MENNFLESYYLIKNNLDKKYHADFDTLIKNSIAIGRGFEILSSQNNPIDGNLTEGTIEFLKKICPEILEKEKLQYERIWKL